MEAMEIAARDRPGLRQLARSESRLRLRYIELPDHLPMAEEVQSADSGELVRSSVALLETLLVTACWIEATSDIHPGELDAGQPPQSRARREYASVCGLQPDEVFSEHAWFFRSDQTEPVAHQEPKTIPFERVIDLVKAVYAGCPIQALEAIALGNGSPENAHRCRHAYEGLGAFIQRTDPQAVARARAAGRAYAQGAVTIGQASAMLGMDVPDVVALFEQYGYARSLDTISMGGAARAKVLAALRQDRLHRKGSLNSNRTRAPRHAIASERIENVDARRWIALE